MTAAADEFRAAIEAAGLRPPEHIIPDGKLHRFASNGRHDDDAGWYVLFADGTPAGSFGDWRSGLKETWRAKSDVRMTDAARSAHRDRIAAMQCEREAEEQRRHAEAAQRAHEIWTAAQPAEDAHPYLRRKQVRAHGLRRTADGRLIVPIYKDAVLSSLEFIDPDGGKKFLSGGAKRAGSFTIGDPATAATLLLVEGYATGASLHEATNLPVIVAFDAGNLRPVAEGLRRKYPASTIIVCGDHDTSGVGQRAADEAAAAVAGLIARRLIPFRWVGGRLVFVRTELEAWVRGLDGCSLEEAQANAEARR